MVDADHQVDAYLVRHFHDFVGTRPIKGALAVALDVAPAKVHLDPAKARVTDDRPCRGWRLPAATRGRSACRTPASSCVATWVAAQVRGVGVLVAG